MASPSLDIPDFTDFSKEIKGQNILIVTEVREGMTAQDQFRRFTKGISAFEESENEGNGWKTKGKPKEKETEMENQNALQKHKTNHK